MIGFTVACLMAALVLLSAPVFGTGWTGATRESSALRAAAIPVAAGLLAALVLLAWERGMILLRRIPLERALKKMGLDGRRPALYGLQAYYDTQLVLLRSEYEYLRLQGAERSARLLEESFGFTPEDPFESGPLNVMPDTREMGRLRRRWEQRLAARRERGWEPPPLGLQENLAYQVFPREMTVPVELETRGAYLEISYSLMRRRYGRDPRRGVTDMPTGFRRRVERDLGEYAAVTQRPGQRPPPAAR